MEIVTRYMSNDGRLFADERACLQWEMWTEDLDAANTMLGAGATIWDALAHAHRRDPYDWASYYDGSTRQVLHALKQSSELEVSHWADGRFSPVRIETNGDVLVHGQTRHGYYGNPISIRELVRFAKANGIGV